MNIKKLFIASLLFLGISFLGAGTSDAATYQIAQGSDGGQLYATVNNIKAVYSPGESVRASMCLYNNSGALNSTSLAGGTNGTWKTYVTGTGCNDTEVGIAPNSAGSYAVNYTANYNRSASPQCSDGVDNDGDGLVDYPADPGCSSPSDNDEYNAPTGNPGSGGTVKVRIEQTPSLGQRYSVYVQNALSSSYTVHFRGGDQFGTPTNYSIGVVAGTTGDNYGPVIMTNNLLAPSNCTSTPLNLTIICGD